VTAEFYYPTYRTRTSSNGNTYTEFDGYQYTHAMVLGIDPSGNKEFEHCIPLKLDFKPFVAYQTLRKVVVDDEVKFVYIASNKIYTATIADGDLKENEPKIFAEVDDDKKLKSTSNYINGWYDNFYFCYSSQTTKEKGKLVGGRETNYYLIKYRVD